MEICGHPMVPRAPLFYFPGGTTAALRLPTSPLRMRGLDGPPLPMKSRLTEAAPLPAAAAAPEFTLDDDALPEGFLIDDYIVLDGAESPCKEAPEEAGKGVTFPAALSSAVPAELQPLSEIILPEHDPTEFEWVSMVIDESLHPPSPGVFPCRLATPTKLQPRIQPPEKRRALVLQPPQPAESEPLRVAREAYPIFSRKAYFPVKAKRSKRPRIESRRPDSASSSPVYSPSSSSSSGSGSGSGSGSYSSFPPYRQSVFFYEGSLPREKPKKKRGRKPRLSGGAGSSTAMAERRCTHCGSQKTPQWRTGPMGPKTLCNACGVRFKSGRLMPEYRPAASPTFDSHVHANSHRKVLEMRRKKEHHLGTASTPVESY